MAVVELVAMSRFGGVECRSVYHINSVVDATNDAEAAADQLWSALTTYILPDIHTSVQYYGCTYRNISVPGMPSLAASVNTITGAGVAEILPRQTQALVTWRAAAPPPNAARKFLQGYTEASNGPAGEVLAGTFGRLSQFAQVFTTHNNGAGGANYQWVAVRKNPLTGLATAHNTLTIALPRAYWAVLTGRRN